MDYEAKNNGTKKKNLQLSAGFGFLSNVLSTAAGYWFIRIWYSLAENVCMKLPVLIYPLFLSGR